MASTNQESHSMPTAECPTTCSADPQEPQWNVRLPKPSSQFARWPLKQNVVHLDHGSFGGCPIEITELQNEIRRSIESDTHDFFVRKYAVAIRNSKEALGDFINADPDGLVLVPGATYSLNVVIQGQSFKPGDEILTTSHAYSSSLIILKHVAKRDGAKLVMAEVPYPTASNQQVLDSILACTTERTRLAVIDHVPSRTGLILPIKEIVAELESRGIDSLVDGAHAPGMIEVNLRSINAAYYAASCHKWMCAPRGVGFLHVRKDRIDTIKPLIFARTAYPANHSAHSSLEHCFDWLGTGDPSAYLSLPMTIKFIETLIPGGHRALFERNHALAIEARNLVCRRLELTPPCPDDMVGSMVSIPLPDSVQAETDGLVPLQTMLWEKHHVEVPIYQWPSYPKRVLRFSVQAHNLLEQYAWLAELLRAALDEEKAACKC